MVNQRPPKPRSGRLVAFEGLDGSGKSTQARLLIESLKHRGLDSEYISFPRIDERGYGEAIAMFLRGEFGSVDSVHPYLVAALFAGDRAAASASIRTWLSKGKLVVSDRYFYSNAAFQSAKLRDEVSRTQFESWIRFLEFSCNRIPRPDFTLFLDVPVEIVKSNMLKRKAHNRPYLRGQADIHEDSISLQARVAEEYRRLASADPTFHVVSCVDNQGEMRSVKDIHSEVVRILDSVRIMLLKVDI